MRALIFQSPIACPIGACYDYDANPLPVLIGRCHNKKMVLKEKRKTDILNKINVLIWTKYA